AAGGAADLCSRRLAAAGCGESRPLAGFLPVHAGAGRAAGRLVRLAVATRPLDASAGLRAVSMLVGASSADSVPGDGRQDGGCTAIPVRPPVAGPHRI